MIKKRNIYFDNLPKKFEILFYLYMGPVLTLLLI